MSAIPTESRGRAAVRRSPFLPILALAAFTLSCAAPAELARRSEYALSTGNSRLAYQWAERAMKADPDLPRARNAMTAAIGPISADWQQRVRALASSDTVAAARLSSDFAGVRAQVAGWGIPVPLDSTYLLDQETIRHAAARQLYDRGVDLEQSGKPREAYRLFTDAGEIVPGFRDVAERAHISFEKGISRVAVLPFDDDAGAPGLASDLATYIQGQLAANMPQKKYPFLRFVPNGEAQERSRTESRMTREAAIRIGRSLGANRVIWGRLSGLRSDTDRNTWHDTIYRRMVSKGEDGKEKVRWDAVPIELVERIRNVSIGWSYEIIETDEEHALASREGRESATARVQFTRFRPEGRLDEYSFAPADWKSGREDDWKSAQKEWKERHGDWSVAEFLEANGEHRNEYRRGNRDAYVNRSRPWIGDALPPAEDLAYAALRDVANPIWDSLKGLEREPSQ